jgi:hypothetical protein
MLLADAGIAVWIIGFLLVGVLGFAVMILALVFRFIGWTFRAVTGGSTSRTPRSGAPAVRQHRLTCPHRGCGTSNQPTAIFCGRCGRPLRRTYDVDAHG